AVTEPEALPDREGVPAAAVRSDEPRRALGQQLRARRTCLVRIVVELRCGRILEPPRSRDVGDLWVDLDRGPGRPVLPDPALFERVPGVAGTRQARGDQKACPGHE